MSCTDDCKQGRACSCAKTDADPKPLNLAPGVLEGYRVPILGTEAQRRELVRWLVPALLFTVVVGLSGLAVGLIAGALQ